MGKTFWGYKVSGMEASKVRFPEERPKGSEAR